MKIHTIGHSTLSQEEFVSSLKKNEIDTLVDVRSFPGSRMVPHFNKERMSHWLLDSEIAYVHLVGLGGRRRTPFCDSPNKWWKHDSFRSYADYTSQDGFQSDFKKLMKLGKTRSCAIMCSESVWWRCHRRILSDHLLFKGVNVQHIMGGGVSFPAELSEGAVIKDGVLTYPEEQPELPL